MHIHAHTIQVHDLRELAAKSALLQEGAEGGKGQLAVALEAYRSNVLALQDKLEASVAEINRGNAIIQVCVCAVLCLRKCSEPVIRVAAELLLCLYSVYRCKVLYDGASTAAMSLSSVCTVRSHTCLHSY
jgi:hypothetical protein